MQALQYSAMSVLLYMQAPPNVCDAGSFVCRIECSQCGKWRIISYAKMTEAKDADWVCRLLR